MSEEAAIDRRARRDAAKRKILFVPCTSKEALHKWIYLFLGLDIPDCIVDSTSNSSPMDMIWETYSKALYNNDKTFNRVLYYASRDSFKCQRKGTLILTRDCGLVPIEGLRVGDVIWSGREWRPVTDWIHDGVKESVTLTLENGLQNTGSPIHRVWAWKPGHEPGWVALQDLTVDDVVCVDTAHGYGQGEVDSEKFDVGYLCGILQGDGCLTLMRSHGRVCITASDAVVYDAFRNACLRYVGREPKKSASRPYDYYINSKKFVALLESWGLTDSYSYEKDVPSVVLESRSAMAGFVSGLYDTDGSIGTTDGAVQFQLTAQKMLKRLQVVLAALGVPSRYRANKKVYEGQKHLVGNIIVSQNDAPDLLAAGVRLRAFKANSLRSAKTPDAHDSVPVTHLSSFLNECKVRGGRDKKGLRTKPKLGYKTVTRDKLRKLADWALERGLISQTRAAEVLGWCKNRWVRVDGIARGSADFYDLTVDVDHSYWSGGLISHNTLGSAILEVLAVLHLQRSVAHMAAIESQSRKSQQYVKQFFQKPMLRDYVSGDNLEIMWIRRYQNMYTGENLPEAQWKALPQEERDIYDEIAHYIRIVIATLAGANSEHVPFFVIDEVEVVRDPKAYEEAKMIPTEYQGKRPITLLTSTRKTSTGLVQQEMEKEFDKKGKRLLHIRHWNLIDVTERCPPERHLPQEQQIPIYVNDDQLQAIGEDEYGKLSDVEKGKYKQEEGFAGCLKNCSIFSACHGNLAIKQRSTSPLLKSIEHTTNQLATVSVPTAQAQLLCKKPSTEGLVYPNFERELHVITASQMAEKILGFPVPEGLSKEGLISIMQERGLICYAGMDFGYTHNFAVVTMFVDGYRAFVVDVIAEPELLPDGQVKVCTQRIKAWDPVIFADPESPQMIATFRNKGFRMREWMKGPGSVVGGINIVHLRLRPPMSEPLVYFLAGDPGVDLLAKRMTKYHWKRDAADRITDKPSDVDDDECDAIRYALMNIFAPERGRIQVAGEAPQNATGEAPPGVYTVENWMERVIEDVGGHSSGSDGSQGHRGRFRWSI
jgi:LAGLIDADG-like domain